MTQREHISSISDRGKLTLKNKCKHCIYLKTLRLNCKDTKFCIKQCKMYKYINSHMMDSCKYFTYKK